MSSLKKFLKFFGLHKVYALRKSGEYASDYVKFKKMSKDVGLDKDFKVNISEIFPILSEKTATHGFDRHYIFHTAWAARVAKKLNPNFLVDISSSLYFSSIVSAFIPVKFYDYRPADLNLEGLSSAP